MAARKNAAAAPAAPVEEAAPAPSVTRTRSPRQKAASDYARAMDLYEGTVGRLEKARAKVKDLERELDEAQAAANEARKALDGV